MIKVSTTGMAVSKVRTEETWTPDYSPENPLLLALQLSKMGFYHIYFCFESIIWILTKPFFNQFTIYELAYDFFFFFIKITNPVIAAITPTPHIILNHRQYNIPT